MYQTIIQKLSKAVCISPVFQISWYGNRFYEGKQMMTVNFIINIWCNVAILRMPNLFKLSCCWVCCCCYMYCLFSSLMFISLSVDWVAFVLVLLSEPPLLCQLLEKSRTVLVTCKVKDSTVVAGNKQVNTPDTDTSLELIKDLREYFGS